MKETLLKKIENRTAKVAVIGMGYVGLPLATILAEAGFEVVGIDPDQRKIEALARSESYIQDIPSERIAPLVESGKLRGETEYAVVTEVDAVSICVPTPLRKTKDPDLSYILSAVDALSPHIHQGMVIVLESTTYPGTTRELLLPKLVDAQGLKAGKDIFLAFSPERVDPGREDWTTENTPKVVGGVTEACTEVAAALYGAALETIIPVSSSEVAEMTKLMENTFRMVNIGLANEMALMCDKLGVDVWEVIDAAATKPFGFMKFTPGPGLGGHCIPLDPHYLAWKLRSLQYTARFIELASEINANMPHFVIQKVQDALNDHGKPLKGSKVMVLGVAYKPDIDDLRESPAIDVIGLLLAKGAEVSYHDPYISEVAHDSWELKSVPDLMEEVSRVDCVVIVTNHSDYDYASIFEAATLIVDTRNALGEAGLGSIKVVRL
ncbi:MAG: UDP-N-acetyl-D-glucosamine dehydrogenase [Anaerolineaceae bacterium 4572_5.1]|nr:MAG: UDP-N-acetyl-D-glucosamine dehydrogenase [Anaerolineaceae bacterium 4572_5.1]